MPAAYSDVAEMAADDDLRQRVYACVASLGVDNVQIWADRWTWLLVARDPGWADRWASYAGVVTIFTAEDGTETRVAMRRGWDSAVITDSMILEQVQAVRDEKGSAL